MWFPSRRWRLGLLAALLLVGAVALGCALWPSPKVTEANFEKLQVGMTPQQVDDILGAENRGMRADRMPLWWKVYQEDGGDVVIAVKLVEDRLADKGLQRVPQTLGDFLRGRLAKVRRRLGL